MKRLQVPQQLPLKCQSLLYIEMSTIDGHRVSHPLAMTTPSKDSQQNPETAQRLNSTGVSSVVISLMTGPFLVTLMGVRTVAEVLEQVGIASEELFRGVRLPDLHDRTAPADRVMDEIDSE